MSITTNEAWALCAFVDGGGIGNPPSPWARAWTPSAHFDDNYALVLTTGSTYALVIQGTKNLQDLLEDRKVAYQVPFPWITGAQISKGSLDGMNKLLALTASGGTSLQAFLQAIPAGSQMVVTGHSLGGNLASVFAPWIAGTVKAFGGPQRPVSKLPSTIQAITFAATTAGNPAFASFLDGQNNYQAYFNTNDVIPYLWAASGSWSAYNIQNMFSPPGPNPAPSDVWDRINNILTQIKNNNLVYAQAIGQGQSFTYPTRGEPPLDAWMREMDLQHNAAYASQFGSGQRAS